MGLQNTSSDRSADSAEESASTRKMRSAVASVFPLEPVGFWLAITLPIPTVLLLAGGVSTVHELAAVCGLLSANLLAFYIGHGYSTDNT